MATSPETPAEPATRRGGRASLLFPRDVNMAWVPSVAPWNGQRVPIVKDGPRGVPWPANEAWVIPAGLEFVAWLDFFVKDLIPGTEWVDEPDTDTLAEQEAQASWARGQELAYHLAERDKRRSALPVVGTLWAR